MVQCQRTRFYIEDSTDGQTFTCARCDDHETYRRVDPDEHAHEVVTRAVAMCRKHFAVDDDGIPTVVWLGERPESVFEEALRTFHVYLGRTSNPLQVMYSGAHEAVHRVCSHNAHHWAHEMMAVLFSLRFLDLRGEAAHAHANRVELSREAERCSLKQFLAQTSVPYASGIYGRAYIVGQELTDAIGWDLLKPLALAQDDEGNPCVESWLSSLPDWAREKARAVLTPA